MPEPYSLSFTAAAADQTRGLPADAYRQLVTLLTEVIRAPQAATEPDGLEDSPSYRWAPFGPPGAAAGFVHVYIDEPARTVRVYDITWTG